MTPSIPAVGRVVHYVAYGSAGGEYPQACRAAIVTEVMALPTDDKIPRTKIRTSLCVLNPTGQFFNTDVPYDHGARAGEGYEYTTEMCGGLAYGGGTWHWPERV